MKSAVVKQYPFYRNISIGGNIGHFIPTSNNEATRVRGVIEIEDGSEEVTTEVKMNQQVKLIPAGPFSLNKYTAIVSYNPVLADLGQINCPTILLPGDELFLILRPRKSFNLAELDYIFTVIVLD